MELEQKNRIMKRFLTEKSENPIAMDLKDEDLASYADLNVLLEHIEHHQNGLFNFETLETDPNQWREFCSIIKYATTFKPGSPPLLKRISLKKAEEGLRYTLNAHDIVALPNDNYYMRSAKVLTEIEPELNELILNSRVKLYTLVHAFPETLTFDASNTSQIILHMSQLEEEILLLDNDSKKEQLRKKLTILHDLKKINELKQLCIAQDDGSTLDYCTLAEDIGGVTEKIPLVSLKSVKKQLRNLCECSEHFLIDNYYAAREQYKLCTEAIIKLPKRGDIREVQHEAIALNISRLLGLDTAITTSITYNNHPALFIIFSDIRLLSDFSSGKTFTSWLSGKTYTHYSTIKPVGEGLEADCFIDDFGKALSLFYICSDPDTIGGNCQNKALKEGKSLFIFDQSLMGTDKFILDSRLCLIPGEFLRKHTRHGIGRNRTIIEDSSFNSKFESIMQLKNLKDKLVQYVNHVAWQHHQKITKIQRKLKKNLGYEKYNQLTTQLNNLIILEKDAEILKAKIQERIKTIENLLPQTTGEVSSIEIRQALIFEKLIHNPILFSDDGRPYKNPWTYRQFNTIKKVDDLGNGSIQLTFDDKISTAMVEFIKRRSKNDSIVLNSAKTILITKEQLMGLTENLLHPEHQLILNPSTNYIDLMDLIVIKEAYNVGNRSRVINTIASYRTKMNCDTSSREEKIVFITETENQLKTYLTTAYDKGFCKHVLKKFYFEAQQQLQKLMPILEIPTQLNDAFIAALQLDRVSEFNSVVMEAITHDKINDSQFVCFLEECIQRRNSTKNYIEAQQQSRELSNTIEKTIHQLRASKSFTVLLTSKTQYSELNQVDPIIINKPDLEKGFTFIKEPLIVVANTEEINEQEQIIFSL
ncbi:coiled-coil protein [Legionella cincinnatiensis]|uniref:Coiled-coil protein n=2 Tax=Legionella cincinnatiensis TaxID=28085 RepID=A0A378IL79_9GAMM|nr:coiled-coil protein [Legionella cincinnatiensis]STX35680.1 coiled-coil protein [Legionella cincinnatiensis]